MTTTKPTPTEAHYVALRVIAAMLRDVPKRANVVARHPEVTRSILWLVNAFGGIDALSEASGLISQEQRELRRAYEAGASLNDIRDAIMFVLSDEKGLDNDAFRRVTERLVVVMSNHVADMARQQMNTKPKVGMWKADSEPLPDACLAISSEE